MVLGGYKDRIAQVDLSTGTIAYDRIDEEIARKYVGARGMGVKFVMDAGPKVEPFSEENLLCFMTGPISGSLITMSGRMALVTKSPLTGTVTDSHHGGWSGARLKWAGLDGIVFRGRSPKPVYAYVEGGLVTLHDASAVWGKGVHDTVRAIQEKHGEKDLSVVTIGPAGEHLVKFACFINENDRASGRGGTGAVAGWKRLKAVVIKADNTGMPRPGDPANFEAARSKGTKAILASAVTKPKDGALHLYGTNVLMNIVNEAGGLPRRNSQTTDYPQAEEISGETIRKTILTDDPTCHACPVACKKEVEVKEGPFKHKGESFEYESAWALGANCDLGDRHAVAMLIQKCNDYGVDTIETGNVLSMAMEASEKGLITEEVPWGNARIMLELLDDLAHRKGRIGDVLAEGTERAARTFGDPNIAMTVKGQAIPAYDPRGLKGMGLGYATSNRGACHLRGYTPASELLGIPEKTDRLAWKGKGKLLKIFQDLHAASDSFDLCKFSAFAEGAEEYAVQLSAMWGVPVSSDEVMKIGERIYNLERYYNNLVGFTGKDDTLPKRFLTEPGTGNSKGSVCELEPMLEEYYRERGWVDGVVPKAKLQELGII